MIRWSLVTDGKLYCSLNYSRGGFRSTTVFILYSAPARARFVSTDLFPFGLLLILLYAIEFVGRMHHFSQQITRLIRRNQKAPRVDPGQHVHSDFIAFSEMNILVRLA